HYRPHQRPDCAVLHQHVQTRPSLSVVLRSDIQLASNVASSARCSIHDNSPSTPFSPHQTRATLPILVLLIAWKPPQSKATTEQSHESWSTNPEKDGRGRSTAKRLNRLPAFLPWHHCGLSPSIAGKEEPRARRLNRSPPMHDRPDSGCCLSDLKIKQGIPLQPE